MTFLNSVIAIGVPSIIIALIYIGRKLQILDRVELDVQNIESDVKNIKERFIVLEERVRTLWKDDVSPAHSPRRLNAKGIGILNGSGIKEIIEAKRIDFLNQLKLKGLKNPYDAEQCVLQAVNDLKFDDQIVEKLKFGAFSVGADIDTVLLVGGFYLRDLIFSDLGFSLQELDKK